jgi:hypothetical protein
LSIRPDPANIFAALNADAAARSNPRRHTIHRHHATPRDHLGKARLAIAKMLRADRGADTISGNHHIGFDLAAVGKARDRRAVERLGADTVDPKLQRRIANGRAQHGVDVGAMGRHVRDTEFFRVISLHGFAETQARIVPLQRDHIGGLERVAPQFVAEAERAQNPHAVGPDLQTSTDFLELGGALVERNFDPVLAQRARGSKTADARADDGDTKGPFRKLLCH